MIYSTPIARKEQVPSYALLEEFTMAALIQLWRKINNNVQTSKLPLGT